MTTKPKRLVVPILCLVIALAAGGCVRLSKEFPEKRLFVLELPSPGKVSSGSYSIDVASAPAAGTALKVRKFRVSPAFAGKELVYRKGEAVYETDFYNQFFIAPGAQVATQTQKWLTEAGLFATVLDPASHVEPTHMLEGVVNALYGDYRTKPGQAVLAVQFFLVRETNNGPKIVMQKSYRREVPLEQRSPEALIEGWATGLAEILAALEDDLRAADLTTAKPDIGRNEQ